MITVIRTAAAEADLEDIYDYLHSVNPAAAEKILRGIYERFRLIEEQPEIGRARPELGEGVRSFTTDDYVLFYRVQGETVEVGRIMHGTRDVTEEFRLVPFYQLLK